MSTALWMLEDGGYDVTVLDKCGILPAPDAASTGELLDFCPSALADCIVDLNKASLGY